MALEQVAMAVAVVMQLTGRVEMAVAAVLVEAGPAVTDNVSKRQQLFRAAAEEVAGMDLEVVTAMVLTVQMGR